MMYTMKRNEFIIIKAILDKVFSIIILILLSPLFLIIGVFIKLDSKGPVFFVQERAGKNGKIFRAYKLRTRVQGADKLTKGIIFGEDNPYITKVGKFIRRIGFDELVKLIKRGYEFIKSSNYLTISD